MGKYSTVFMMSEGILALMFSTFWDSWAASTVCFIGRRDFFDRQFLESIFPHLGMVPRPNHCSIYIRDLLSSAVSAQLQ